MEPPRVSVVSENTVECSRWEGVWVDLVCASYKIVSPIKAFCWRMSAPTPFGQLDPAGTAPLLRRLGRLPQPLAFRLRNNNNMVA